MSTAEKEPSIVALTDTNYPSWSVDMTFALKGKGWWHLVHEEPTPEPDAATAAQTRKDLDAAACLIYSSVSRELRDHLQEFVDDDPAKPHLMWAKLRNLFANKQPGFRRRALYDLMLVKKAQDESLLAFAARATSLSRRFDMLLKPGMSLAELKTELLVAALIEGLPDEYAPLKDALQTKTGLTKDDIMVHFQQRMAVDSSEVVKVESAFAARPGFSHTTPYPARVDGVHVASKWCVIHRNDTHTTDECRVVKACAAAYQAKPQGRDDQAQTKPGGDNASQVMHLVLGPGQHDADHRWLSDTGASAHLIRDRNMIWNMREASGTVVAASGDRLAIKGVGDVHFQPTLDGRTLPLVVISDVFWVPGLQEDLFAAFTTSRTRGLDVDIRGSRFTFHKAGEVYFTASATGNDLVARLDGDIVPAPSNEQAHSAAVAMSVQPDLKTLHERFCHLSYDGLRKLLAANLIEGITCPPASSAAPHVCTSCLAGKHARDAFPSSRTRAQDLLGIIHTDIHEMPTRDRRGFKYFISFIDDVSRYATVCLLKTKSGREVLAAFKVFQARVETETGRKIKILRSDGGGEYNNTAFADHRQAAGILWQHSTPYTPQQNGVAERFNRTLEERVIAMLDGSPLDARYWGDAVQTYMVVHNMCPTAALPRTTPFERFFGHKPNAAALRTFGATAYVQVPRVKRKHLDSHSQKCIFIGYPKGVKGWRFLNTVTGSIFESRDAVFDESSTMSKLAGSDLAPPPRQSILVLGSSPAEVPLPDASRSVAGAKSPSASSDEHTSEVSSTSHSDSDSSLEPEVSGSGGEASETEEFYLSDGSPYSSDDGSGSDSGPFDLDEVSADSLNIQDELAQLVKVYPELAGVTAVANLVGVAPTRDGQADHPVLATSVKLPRNVEEALAGPQSSQWREAMGREIQSCVLAGTWQIVELPRGKKAVKCRWVFTVKENADGTIERFKARIVAKGFTQRPGIDFNETFAPVARFSSIRAILHLAACQDWELDQLDITTAFLNGDLDEEIFMEQPPGFEEGGPGSVCRLQKSLYGLRQSPRQWNIKLHEALQQMGFTRLKSDNSVYLLREGSDIVIMAVYVDDQMLASNSRRLLDKVKRDLASRFTLRDLGALSVFLGVHITRDRGDRKISLSQSKYVDEILDKFSMAGCSTQPTPLSTSIELPIGPTSEAERQEMRDTPYLSAVGSLGYLSCCTRPDIAHAVGLLGRFAADPRPEHWTAVKRVMRYLKGTRDLALTLGKGSAPHGVNDNTITVYSDADFAADKSGRRSTSGSCITIGSGLVSWHSKKQPVVALSTAEAEFMAAVVAGTEAVWLRMFLGELGFEQSGSTRFMIDNQGAIELVKHPVHQSRAKHIDIKYFWLREKVEERIFTPTYLQTDEMLADPMTKALPKEKHELFLRRAGLEAPRSSGSVEQ